MRRLLLTVPLATATALLLTACGTTEPAADDVKESTEAITLTGASGEKVELDGPAKKVVGTEWNVVESLISLGVDPVGVADVKGYTTWDTAVPLENEPKDIGTRGEPSMDAIASLKPDLIVTTTDLQPNAVKQLRKVAPVLEVKSADASDPIGRMLENVDLIAQATGTTERAATLKKDFEAKLAAGRKALADAGLDGAEIAFADGYVNSNQVSLRPYTSGSLIGAVNERLGLRNAWKQKGDEAYGLAATDVEGLTDLGKVQFVHIGNDQDPSSDPFGKELAKNSVWTSLPFVKSGDVHRIDDGIWMFGGTGSMEAYADSLVAALTK
ncbi:iron-siderophore ABC transporter substrate-binding protein [Streptomyces griseoloalbus]|uniref:Iron complex transport system substrate-binding protein n=1 Tax=Streptomyces griseoloalbus TaxID=67303 RepID=A0A7W8BME6_9ACTN|nr:iron-siderophore ABC transporter substrate-binding protein [Streptomyces albaduncus]MBB5126066.1 iron complex transport system substrate-binding protein [Streptomyces albaduncus]GGV63571.1 ABC transporter substrate-binding protein [Streptomyces griseoloalbus]GGW77102.1 ABC transporter substrate-binding protein [Streptomyces albaduncus]